MTVAAYLSEELNFFNQWLDKSISKIKNKELSMEDFIKAREIYRSAIYSSFLKNIGVNYESNETSLKKFRLQAKEDYQNYCEKMKAYNDEIKYFFNDIYHSNINMKCNMKKAGKSDLAAFEMFSKLYFDIRIPVNYKEILKVFNRLNEGDKKIYDDLLQTAASNQFNKETKMKATLLIEVMQDNVIKSGAPEKICKFAYNFRDAGLDFEKLTNAIIQLGQPEYIYQFAKEIKDANLSLLTEAIITCGEAEYIYQFARNIENADIDLLGAALLEIGDKKYFRAFQANILGLDAKRFDEFEANKKQSKE